MDMTTSANGRRASYGLFSWGLLAFIMSLVSAYSFGSPRHHGAKIADLIIAALTPAAFSLIIAVTAIAVIARSARRNAVRADTNAILTGLKGLLRAFRSDWPMMIGTMLGLAALYNLLFLIHWKFW